MVFLNYQAQTAEWNLLELELNADSKLNGGGKKDAILNKEIKEHHVAYYKLIDG